MEEIETTLQKLLYSRTQGGKFGSRKNSSSRTRKCYSCNKTGHLVRDCPTKKADTAFVGCILSYKPPDAHDKEIIK
jgi:Zinc knuckle